MWTALALRRRDPSARVVLLEAAVCGEGPSGRNAGFANSYWHHFEHLADGHGAETALAACRLGDRSVDAIGEFAAERGAEIAYRKGGHLKVSTSPPQDGAWLGALRACEAGGSPESMVALSGEAVRARCDSPLFREGAYIAQAATVQPALLARALRDAVLDSGATVAEGTRARALRSGTRGGVEIDTDGGARVRAASAVIAINAAAAGFKPLRSRLAVTSTHMIITEPVPDVLEEVGWTGGECISTSRRFLHYFRTTDDGRIAFGWGAGTVAYGARLGGRIEVDPRMAEHLRADILEFFPGLRGRRVDAAWGGPVDVSPTHLPSIGTVPGPPVHYVCGFTGNGVGPSHLRRRDARVAGARSGRRAHALALRRPTPAAGATGAAALDRRHGGARRAAAQGGARGCGQAGRSAHPGGHRASRAPRDPPRSLVAPLALRRNPVPA